MLHKMLFALVLGISMIYGVANAQPTARFLPAVPVNAEVSRAVRHHARLLDRYDTNNDHRLDSAEKAAMRDARARARFRACDVDRDGVISLGEFESRQ